MFFTEGFDADRAVRCDGMFSPFTLGDDAQHQEVDCGDGACDPDGGETLESCPVDCDASCETLTDCLALE